MLFTDFYFFFFFFSSRRRHTRYIGDWSSDVCSSDLARHRRLADGRGRARGVDAELAEAADARAEAQDRPSAGDLIESEIGRASCRERGEVWGGAGAGKKKSRRYTYIDD